VLSRRAQRTRCKGSLLKWSHLALQFDGHYRVVARIETLTTANFTGSQFLKAVRAEPINLVLNWDAEIKK